ncbi:uncharacterized protein LOC144882013 isoform X2 [Branchiostoma floridae x Branchiostoma japonicum]
MGNRSVLAPTTPYKFSRNLCESRMYHPVGYVCQVCKVFAVNEVDIRNHCIIVHIMGAAATEPPITQIKLELEDQQREENPDELPRIKADQQQQPVEDLDSDPDEPLSVKEELDEVAEQQTDGPEKAGENPLPSTDPRAHPLASPELTAMILYSIRRIRKDRHLLMKGPKGIRGKLCQGEIQFLVLAANTKPLSRILHLCRLCEKLCIPYVFVRSRQALRWACGTKGKSGLCVAAFTVDHHGQAPLVRSQINFIRRAILRLHKNK